MWSLGHPLVVCRAYVVTSGADVRTSDGRATSRGRWLGQEYRGVQFFTVLIAPALANLSHSTAVNQVECHPYLRLADLHRYCQAHNIHVTGYSPLGSPDRPDVVSKEVNEPLLLQDETIAAIATKHGVSPAQVLLHWGVVCGPHSVLCKSSSPSRLEQNVASLSALVLNDDDKAQLKALDRHRRYITGAFWIVENGPYTMENLWDEGTTVDNLLAEKK